MKRPTTLSAAFVRSVKEPGRYGDGRGGYGLSLLVKPMTSTGRTSRTWSQRLRVNGQIVAVGLGSFPVVSLSQARDKALENKRTLAEGVDPRTTAASMPTFAEIADKVITLHAAELARQRQVRKAMAGQFADLCLPDARRLARCLYNVRRRPGSAHADLELEA